ncbi:MAG: ATP-binding protein [Coriobacteriia bacterium]|nr:ATP-binding protein [Coriobacteriia bacterium]
MFTRNLKSQLKAALSRSPVVLLNGARQVGKTTLARELVSEGAFARYSTLDQLAVLDAARTDPEGFVSADADPIVIDEVQLEPRLFRAIKAEVDRDRRPGRFLLTGSADLSVMPTASDALVGRMETLTLWPLSQGEIAGVRETFIDALLGPADAWHPAAGSTFERAALASAICAGGFPEPLLRAGADREPWFRSYTELVVRRDIAERTDISGLAAMPRLLALLAARTMTLVSLAEVARSLEMPATTVRRYVDLLQAAMLVRMVPAYAGDLARRVVKSPKVAVIDTGLAASLAGLSPESIQADPVQFGRLAETFVVNELERQLGWSSAGARLMHARTAAGREVDVVIEARDGRIAGVEVKAGRTVGSGDFAGLKALRQATGERFTRGVVLHTGTDVVPFSSDLWAVPMNALWETTAIG